MPVTNSLQSDTFTPPATKRYQIRPFSKVVCRGADPADPTHPRQCVCPVLFLLLLSGIIITGLYTGSLFELNTFFENMSQWAHSPGTFFTALSTHLGLALLTAALVGLIVVALLSLRSATKRPATAV